MKQKAFSFSSDCKSLEQSIKRIVAVSGSGSANYFIGIMHKSVYVFGLGADTFVMLSVPNTQTDSVDGVFGFDAECLPGLIKGRSIMEFKYTGTECLFSQTKGKYAGKISAVSATEDQLEQLTSKSTEKLGTASSITSDQLTAIKSSLSATGVKDVYQNTILLSYINMLADGRLTVSSFDAQHFGLARIRLGSKGAEFRAALPSTHFSVVEALAAGSDVQFKITNTGLKASGSGFSVSLPATQAEDRHFNMVPEFIKSLPKPVFECEFQVDKLITIVDNLFTLYNSNSNFVIKTKGPTLSISLSTSSGSASDSIRVKPSGTKDTSLSVDPRLFMDLIGLAKASKTATLRVMDKVVCIAFKSSLGAEVFLSCSRVE